jgi:hypothetical protein
MVKGHDFHQRRLEFLSRLGVLVVQRGRVDLPARGDSADAQSIVKTQTPQLDASQGGRAGAAGVFLLTPGRLAQPRPRPSAIAHPRLAFLSGWNLIEIRLSVGLTKCILANHRDRTTTTRSLVNNPR